MAVWSKRPAQGLLILAFLFFGFGVSGLTAQNAAGKTAAPADEKTRPQVTGTIRQSQLTVGDAVQAWLTISNPGTDALGPIRLLDVQLPGLALESWGIAGETQPRCLAANCPPAGACVLSVLRGCGELAQKLGRGQSNAVWVNLKAVSEAEEASGVVVVGWSPTGAGPVESQVAVTLGPLRVRTRAQKSWEWVYGGVKDFALPVVLPLAALGISFLVKRWELQRTEASETWGKMLEVSYTMTTSHYVHIAAAIVTMIHHLSRYEEAEKNKNQEKAKDHKERAFFNLLFLNRRYLHLYSAAGGYYFKNRTGERLATNCWDSFRYFYTSEFDDRKMRQFTRAAGYLELDETGDTFHEKLNVPMEAEAQETADWEMKKKLTMLDGQIASARSSGDQTALSGLVNLRTLILQRRLEQDEEAAKGCQVRAALELAFTDFEDWLKVEEAKKKSLRRLNALLIVLDVEMNRPFEKWYGELPSQTVNAEVKKTLCAVFTDMRAPDDRSMNCPVVEAYLDKLEPKRVRGS